MTLHQLDTLIETYGDVTVMHAQNLKVKYFTRIKDLIAKHGDITVHEAELEQIAMYECEDARDKEVGYGCGKGDIIPQDGDADWFL